MAEELADLAVGSSYRYQGATHDTVYLVLESVSETHVKVLILDSEQGELANAASDPGSVELLHRGSKWALESVRVA